MTSKFPTKIPSKLILLIGLLFFLFNYEYAACNKQMSKLLMKGKIEEAKNLLRKPRKVGLNENAVKYYTGLLEYAGSASAKNLKESLYGNNDFAEQDMASLRLAHYYFARGFYITCINQLEVFESNLPKSSRKAEAGWLLGMAYLNDGKYNKAQSSFKNVIGNYSNSKFSGWSFMGLGYCYYKQGDYNKAIGSFNRLEDNSSHPAHAQALSMLSHCYELLGNKRHAESYQEKYDREYPQCFFSESILTLPPVSENNFEVKEVDPEAEKLIGAKYYIQVGAYSSNKNAQRMKNKLVKRNYRTKIEKQTVNKQSYYKILVGPYSTRSKAQAAKDKLEREEQDSFLIILK